MKTIKSCFTHGFEYTLLLTLVASASMVGLSAERCERAFVRATP